MTALETLGEREGEGEGEACTSDDGCATTGFSGEDETAGSYNRSVVATGMTSIAARVTMDTV